MAAARAAQVVGTAAGVDVVKAEQQGQEQDEELVAQEVFPRFPAELESDKESQPLVSAWMDMVSLSLL